MGAALESLRNQGMGDDLEIIIQDADIEPDLGQSDALNKGFAKAHGEWLFWLNADDILLPGALRKVKEVINSTLQLQLQATTKSLSWIVGNETFIDKNGRTVGASVGCGWHDGLFHHSVPHVNGPSAFFRRELFERVGRIDVGLKYCMDWDLWIRFAKAGAKFTRINQFLWAQRRWAGSKTQRKISGAEYKEQWGEIHAMLKKNDFAVTRWGNLKVRFWKLITGCYFQAWRAC